MRCRIVLLVVSGALMLASCAGPSSTDSTEPSSATASTTTKVPSTTATTAPQQAVSDGVPFPADEPVDLLVLTDSSGWGLAERYGSLAAEALGREIRVHDRAEGGTPITDILDWLQTSLADEVAEAEIIVIYGFPGDLEYDMPEP